ncbi:hypothetical protein [Egbenema bharatensis]|uniref:hypothetical protein n=1 Tax=Egbenema bharatensis TaxID=3463334 RepID=UPI003A8A13EF
MNAMTMNRTTHYPTDRSSSDAKSALRVPALPRTPASIWRLNAVIMQLKLASAETVNELLLPRTRRSWFV